jgi:hypothetical protein
MESKTILITTYLKLLKENYESISIIENPKVVRVTRFVYLGGILIFWILAMNLPEQRELFSVGILFLAFFLLSSSFRTNRKKRQQKQARRPFDQMVYQLTDVSKLHFDVDEGGMEITLTRKDDTTRNLSYHINQLSAYQKLGDAFLLSNEQGIDFIIPTGILKVATFLKLHEKVKERFTA